MGRAQFQITAEMLEHVLQLPKGSHILDIKQEWVAYPGRIMILVEHKDIPQAPAGEEYPRCLPSFTTKFNKLGRKIKTTFEGWGVYRERLNEPAGDFDGYLS
jgi:hypothetical protein